MGQINLKSVVTGGLLAGLILNVVDYLLYGVYLAPDFDAAMQALGKQPVGGTTIAWFVVLGFLWGILLVYLYAAIRSRFGPGPRTAACAGLLLWVAGVLLHALGEGAMGLFPPRARRLAVPTGLVPHTLLECVRSSGGVRSMTGLTRDQKMRSSHCTTWSTNSSRSRPVSGSSIE